MNIAKIPILTADHMHKGGLVGPANTRCLLGHTFDSPAGSLMEQTMKRMLRGSGFYSIPEFNDSTLNTRSVLAAFWNKARRRVIQNAWRKRQK